MGRCREFFWRAEALAAKRLEGFTATHPGWAEFSLARITLAQGDSIRNWGGELALAALAYRSAARLMLQARLLRAGREGESVDGLAGQWERVLELLPGAPPEASGSDEQWALVRASLGPEGESFLARLPRERSQHAALGLRQLTRRLGAPLADQARGVRRELGLRWLRLGLLAALACLVVGLGWRSVTRVNLARQRPVWVQRRETTAGVHPEALVDGDRNNLGFCTDRHARAKSVTIDLGSPQLVSRVVVYKRPELDSALPIEISIAEQKQYRHVASIEDPFEHMTLDLEPALARYVRVTSKNRELPFHLSEVEVY